jgi:hypothetical protein
MPKPLAAAVLQASCEALPAHTPPPRGRPSAPTPLRWQPARGLAALGLSVLGLSMAQHGTAGASSSRAVWSARPRLPRLNSERSTSSLLGRKVSCAVLGLSMALVL